MFRYHLKDVVVGKIYFLLVRIKIERMEIQIIKKETTGTGIYKMQGFHFQTNKISVFFMWCLICAYSCFVCFKIFNY